MQPRSKLISLALMATMVGTCALASAANPSAKSVIAAASAKAKAEKKNVMVIFHASWCGWCHRMDAFLESPEFKAAFDKSYVITHVDVLEQPAKKDLENAGGVDLMTQLGGKDAGLPFFAILNPSGIKISDSLLSDGKNMGFPSEPQEIAGFKTLLEKSAPKMSRSDISKITAFLSVKKTH